MVPARALVIVTALFVVQAYFAQLVHPDWAGLPQDGSAFSIIFSEAGGNVLPTVLSYAVIAAARVSRGGASSRLQRRRGRVPAQ